MDIFMPVPEASLSVCNELYQNGDDINDKSMSLFRKTERKNLYKKIETS